MPATSESKSQAELDIRLCGMHISLILFPNLLLTHALATLRTDDGTENIRNFKLSEQRGYNL